MPGGTSFIKEPMFTEKTLIMAPLSQPLSALPKDELTGNTCPGNSACEGFQPLQQLLQRSPPQEGKHLSQPLKPVVEEPVFSRGLRFLTLQPSFSPKVKTNNQKQRFAAVIAG